MTTRTTAQIIVAGLALGLALRFAATAHAQSCEIDLIFPDQAITLPDSGSRDAKVADIDGDGDLDIIASGPAIVVHLNDGHGNFTRLPDALVSGDFAERLDIADMDGDGLLDLAVVRRTASFIRFIDIHLGNGDGTFVPTPARSLTDGEPFRLELVDIDLDGDIDVVAGSVSGEALVYRNAGGLNFPSLLSIRTDALPLSQFFVRDLDGDELPEIVLANPTQGLLAFLENRGSGVFDAPVSVVLGRMADMVLEDFNGDGHPDIGFAPNVTVGLDIYLNDGAGNFAAPIRYPGGPFFSLTAFDVDGDGDNDIVGSIGNVPLPLTIVCRNDGAGGFAEQSMGLDDSAAGQQDYIGGVDLTGDGSPDLFAHVRNALAITRNFCSAAPVITQQPVSTLVDAGGNAGFSVRVSVVLPSTTFQWRRDGAPLADGSGIAGATTQDLTISSVQGSDEGFYDCVVTSIGGERTSNAALLAVSGGGSDCPADFDGDGALTLFDFLAFQNAFAAGCP